MLVSNPVQGTIKPDKRFYRKHPLAIFRPDGSRVPLVTHDFGPSSVTQEPDMEWAGGESDIFGRPIPARTYEHFHKAIDISKGRCGDDVLAVAPGEVRVSHKNKQNTEVIVIDHGMVGGHRFETRYAHLEPRLVQVGAPVETGTLIGKLGNSGLLSTGCHLHFAITKDGRPVDPWRRLRQNTSTDPDVPATGAPLVITPVEVADVPIPASNDEYLAGQVAAIGNESIGANIRDAPKIDATVVRTVAAGTTEMWLPTCWVVGDFAFASDRWLTRWHEGRWEFAHQVNVASVTPL